ncbi:hypothetical protein BDZ94DRAFT_1267037 [Collybia nuda]|uniref:Uncharacterized protein n=1 Tax=Collybia nuda TaxID=64659 RepID=A0A9P6CBU9_9AGAR|nr:hypothetical protein BDZ94DRAFT_1267037 [Collybia nuda]
MLCRERRSWTAKEDQLLRDAVEREDPENPNPSKWHAIAKHVPNRTNKDCRKRWFAKMASDVVKGGWAPDEDEKLVKGIERYGTRWSLVASMVQSRNSDQCAKRWTDTLNPAIDRTTWSPDADELLLQAVNEHGKVWTKIVKTYFPGRTGLSAKNRYNSITRFNAEHSRSSRPRRKTPDLLSYHPHRKSESVSSSSSSVSPSTPSIPMPDLASFTSPIDSVPESYLFEHLIGWSQVSPTSDTGDDIPSFYPHHNGYDIKHSNILPDSLLIPSSNITSDHTFELTMNQALSAFPDDGHLLYAPTMTTPHSENSFSQGYHPQQQSNMYNLPTYTPYPVGYSQNDVANHLHMFDAQPSQVTPQTTMNWGGQHQMFDPSRLQSDHRSKMAVEPYVF